MLKFAPTSVLFLAATLLLACGDDDTPQLFPDAGDAADTVEADTADAVEGDTSVDVADPDVTDPDVGTDTVDPDVADDAADDTAEDADVTILCDAGLEWNGTECVAINECQVYEPFAFAKTDGGDEQDCITADVCLTRGNNGTIFNAVTETEPAAGGCDSTSPAGVVWAQGPCFGNTNEFGAGFAKATECSPASAVGRTMCMRLVDSDIAYDVEFSGFTGGGGGGGFAYTRTLAHGGPCASGADCSFDDDTVDCTCGEGSVGDGFSECEPLFGCADSPCNEDATCTPDGRDAVICTCNDGLVGDGYQCFVEETGCETECGETEYCLMDAVLYCGCLTGYRHDDDDLCVDKDECAEFNDNCGDLEYCVNTPGSHRCECNEGFERVEVDGDSECVDIDECADAPCDASAECANTPGGYACVCPDGQALNRAGVCTGVDACADTGAVVSINFEGGDAADCITESVCLARTYRGGPFINLLFEDEAAGGWDGDVSAVPTGTEWAWGPCAPGLTFSTLSHLVSGEASDLMPDGEFCMRTKAEGRMFDIQMSLWASDEVGAFAYERREYFGGCIGDAVCSDLDGGFECTCPAGQEYAEDRGCVSASVCTGSTCGTGGVCVPGTDSFTCVCEPTFTFTQSDAGTEEDCISESVCLTRGDSRNLYNSVAEDDSRERCRSLAPTGTLWANAPCDEATDFNLFTTFTNCGPDSVLGEPSCLYIPADGVYVDIMFTYWNLSNRGFEYQRSRVFHDAACDGD